MGCAAYVIKNEKDITMLNHFLKIQTEEKNRPVSQDAKILLKLAEVLLQEHLITPEEKSCLTNMIRKDNAV